MSTRGLPSALLTAFQAGTLKAIHLLAINTGRSAPNDVVRLTDWDQDIAFPSAGGSSYLSRFADVGAGFDCGEIWTEPTGNVPSAELRIPDGDSLLRGHIAAGAWALKQLCTIHRIEYDQRDDAAKVLKNVYVVRSYANPDYEVVFDLASFGHLLASVDIPLGIVSREVFPGIPPEA